MDKVTEKLLSVRDDYLDNVIGTSIYPAVIGTEQTANPVATLCDYFLRKATKTLDAICILCESGFYEDALVLVRTVFEYALHLHAIAALNSLEMQRHRALCFIYDGDRQRHSKISELAMLKRAGKCSAWVVAINGVDTELMARPQDFKSPANLQDTIKEVGGEWECLHTFLYWSLSKLAHPSGLGSHTYLETFDQDSEACSALNLAVAFHSKLTSAVLTLLGLESLRPSLDEYMKKFISPSSSG